MNGTFCNDKDNHGKPSPSDHSGKRSCKFALNLLLGEVLAPGEVVGELAAPELDGVGARKVGATGGQPLLVVQLLIDFHLN
jgi:hypothetical protein